MSVAQAEECMKKAEKKMSSVLNIFGSKAEDAQDLFQQAATYYKANQKWEEAGNAYLRAQDCAAKQKSTVDCAGYFQDAGLMFKKVNVYKAAECFQKALDLWDQNGRTGKSAKLANELAELFDKAGDPDNAIEWYTKAADYYRAENSTTTANQCMIEAAQHRERQLEFEGEEEVREEVEGVHVVGGEIELGSVGGGREVPLAALRRHGVGGEDAAEAAGVLDDVVQHGGGGAGGVAPQRLGRGGR